MAQGPTQTPLVLLIAEARPTVAAGLRVFLANIAGTRPVAIMTGFDDVVDYAEQNEIGLIIVGQGMNWATPLSEFRRLRERNQAWRLVLLTDVSDRDMIMAALSAGASGIIPTSIEERELHSAISRILAGTIYIPNTRQSVDQHLARQARGTGLRPQASLTRRQTEVLRVLAQGYSNKQIARSLEISESTVSMHLNAAFQALGVHDRTSAAMAYRDMVGFDYETGYDWSSNTPGFKQQMTM